MRKRRHTHTHPNGYFLTCIVFLSLLPKHAHTHMHPCANVDTHPNGYVLTYIVFLSLLPAPQTHTHTDTHTQGLL